MPLRVNIVHYYNSDLALFLAAERLTMVGHSVWVLTRDVQDLTLLARHRQF
jgi:hypothetical protein